MLHRASAPAKRLAAALRRAVPEWQLSSEQVGKKIVCWAMVKRLFSDKLASVHVNAMSTRVCHFASVSDGENRLVSFNVRSENS